MRNDGADVAAATAFDSDDDDAEFTICASSTSVRSEEAECSSVKRGAEEVAAFHLF